MLLPDRIETISVHIDPETVPESDCPNCGHYPVSKVPGKYSLVGKGVTIVNMEPIIDYSCNECGMDGFSDPEEYLLLDKAALAKLEALKRKGINSGLLGALRESIAVYESVRKLDAREISRVRPSGF